MSQKQKQLQELQEKQKVLEAELQIAYLQLGKKTQEFVELESDEINQLVEEIITTKKEIEGINEISSKEKEL